jgi:cytochrome P450
MGATDIEYNPFDRDLYRDPYPIYRRLRDEAPVYRHEALGLVALSRFEDVIAAHADPERFSSEMNLSKSEAADTGRSRQIVFTDPPYHTLLRGLINQRFRPRQIARLEPLIRDITVRRLDAFRGRNEVDVAEELALPVPMEVICRLLGIPAADLQMVQRWADTSIERASGTNQPTAAGMEATKHLQEYFRRARLERLEQPRDDLMSQLAHARLTDDDVERPISEEEFVANANFLAVAGNETTAKGITHAVLLLARHPEQRALLVREPETIPSAVEEILRYLPPSQWQHRVARRDVELHGEKIQSGTFVALITGSACRDERVFSDPDRFDVTRRIDRHVAFGWGRHICMGAWLARLEMRITIEEILRRFPEYDLVEDGLEQNYAINVSGYAKMPIRI